MSRPHRCIVINELWYKSEIAIIKTAKGYKFFGMNLSKDIEMAISASRMIKNIKRILSC